MDLTSQIQIRIRREASSTIYRSALRLNAVGCYGFLIGTREEWIRPVIDAALVAQIATDRSAFAGMADVLAQRLEQCQATAAWAEAMPLGIFVARDTSFDPHECQNLGALIDLTRELQLPYMAVFKTSGYETVWMPAFYFASHFPHPSLPSRSLCRRSHHPQHNPRRIRAYWNSTS